jgi:rare lipoprotein A
MKDAAARKVLVKHRSNPARRLIRNALIASTLAVVLTAGGSVRPALAHGLGLNKTHLKHAPQSERSERRSFRDKLAAAASRSYQHSLRSGLLDLFGIASVYGVQRTASGEQMNSGAMTAAHRTLPFGTKVTVLNRRNGGSAIVRINDRGPFVRGRIIDLSPASAHALDVSGLAPVSLIVETPRSESRPPDNRIEPSQVPTPSPLITEETASAIVE